jgi:PIN domain nuclease of toxin-antitoxin system
LRNEAKRHRFFLIAQAITERMTLLTADRALQKYKVDLVFCGK